MKRLLLILVSAGIMLSTGCASIIDGKSQTVSFASNPDGATVSLNGNQIGKTPVSVVLERKSGSQPLKFSKEGFKDSEVQLTSGMNTWVLGNLISGGLLGSTTDGLSGAAFQYSPGSYMVTLQPAEGVSLPGNLSTTDKQKLVNFIVAGYSHITVELVSGTGPYLSSLMEMAVIPAQGRPEAEKKVKALASVYTAIPDFADKTADLLLKK